MGSNGVAPLAPFLAQHRAQLEGAGVPQLYWPTLHTKLARQLFDAGNTFSIMQVLGSMGNYCSQTGCL